MTFLPTVRDDLAAAARRLEARRQRRRHAARLVLVAGASILALGGVAFATGVVRWPGLDPAVRTSASSPPPTQLAAFGVLRRAQTDADRSPEAKRAVTTFSHIKADRDRFGAVRLDAVRVLLTHDGSTYVLVPRTRQAWSTANHPPQRRVEHDVLCLVVVDPRFTVGGSCATTATVERGLGAIGSGRTFAALVPDRVAAVRVDTCEGVVDVPVHDNFVAYDRLRGWRSVGRQAWLDARGREIGGFFPTPHHAARSLSARCVRRGDARR
jgi:hypothetical protein